MRTAAALAALVLAASVTACDVGGGEEAADAPPAGPTTVEDPAEQRAQEYADAVEGALAPVVEAFAAFERASSFEAVLERAEEAREAAASAAARLEQIEPPGVVRRAHERLVSGLVALEREIERAREALEAARAGELGSLAGLLEQLSEVEFAGVREVERALHELEDAGFAVPGAVAP